MWHILEIVSGTGPATRAFVSCGFAVTCVEPGKNLAAIARGHFKDNTNIVIHEVTFEDWSIERERYDLVMSATAAHYGDSAILYRESSEALKKSGAIGYF